MTAAMNARTLTKTPTGSWKLPTIKATAGKHKYSSIDGAEITENADEITITITKILGEPLVITHHGSAKVTIVAKANSEAKIIERFIQPAHHDVAIELEENSKIVHITLHEGEYAGKKQATAERNSRIDWFELDAGKATSEITTELIGEGADTRILSIFLGENHFNAEAQHKAPYTTSKLFTRGILKQEHATYEGALIIGKDAPKSDAFQRADALLLGEGTIKASPRLFIGNNDVTCSHAATTAKPDIELLFYLQSRGLPEKEAKQMLIKAFIWPVIEELDIVSQKLVADAVLASLENWKGVKQ